MMDEAMSAGSQPTEDADTARIPVASTQLLAVTYDDDSQVLEVETKRGRRYRYTGVPKAVFHDLMGADSKGRYYLRHIRGVFPRQQI
jgi:hypothetical protein